MKGCLCIFVYIWMTSSSPGNRPIKPILWLKVFLDSRLQHESSEGLMDFLTFLVQKLWQIKQKLIREIPIKYSAYSSINWGLLAITLAPESRSRALKTHITALDPTKFRAIISAHCLGDDVTKEKSKSTKHSPTLTTSTENPKPKSQVFFQYKLEDFTSVSKVWIAL